MEPNKISLYVHKGYAHIWNAKDWHTLRFEHRICGQLIGSLPSYPRQDIFLGLPMVLMVEEAALLVEKGFCFLYECNELPNYPSAELQTFSQETEKRIFSEQVDTMKRKRIEHMTGKLDIIIAGKQRKNAERGIDEIVDREAVLSEEIKKLPPVSKSNSLVQIPTEHPWPMVKIKLEIEDLKYSIFIGIGRVKYAVYKDLWEKGLHVTDGEKFGGDFLVYPGDPVKFHALYIVKCLQSEFSKLSLPQIVAFGRLGVAVNKMVVYATIDEEGKLFYQTLRWHDTMG